jgi:hypothetical protein
LGDRGLDEGIILKYALEKEGMKAWHEFSWLRIRFNGGLF